MKNIRIYLIALLAVALSGGSLLLSAAPTTQALSDKDVVVTNTTANPVPVVTQGTTNIAGGVSVTNTPNVNVANSPFVQLSNSASNPLVEQDVDNPARNAYQSTIHFDLDDNVNPECANFPLLPDGKRLVIEYVSADIRLSRYDDLIDSSLVTYLNGNRASHDLPFVLVNLTHDTSFAYDPFKVAEQLRAYSEPPYPIEICISRSSASGPSKVAFATISGYLVDMQ